MKRFAALFVCALCAGPVWAGKYMVIHGANGATRSALWQDAGGNKEADYYFAIFPVAGRALPDSYDLYVQASMKGMNGGIREKDVQYIQLRCTRDQLPDDVAFEYVTIFDGAGNMIAQQGDSGNVPLTPGTILAQIVTKACRSAAK